MEVFSSFNLKMMNLVLLDSLSAWNASAHDGSTATPERDCLLDHRHRVEDDTIFCCQWNTYLWDDVRGGRQRKKKGQTNFGSDCYYLFREGLTAKVCVPFLAKIYGRRICLAASRHYLCTEGSQ